MAIDLEKFLDEKHEAGFTSLDVQVSRGGPQTPAGKESSKNNALTHGFSSEAVAVPETEREAFENHRSLCRHQMKPQSVLELTLVDRMARNAWKLSRIAEEEDRIVDMLRKLHAAAYAALDVGDQERADEAAFVEAMENDRLRLLNRYEQAAERNFHKAMTALAHHRKNPELLLPLELAAAPPAYSQPSYAPRREAPANVQPRTNPPAPNELPSKPQTTVKPVQNGAVSAQNGRR